MTTCKYCGKPIERTGGAGHDPKTGPWRHVEAQGLDDQRKHNEGPHGPGMASPKPK